MHRTGVDEGVRVRATKSKMLEVVTDWDGLIREVEGTSLRCFLPGGLEGNS